MPDTRTRVGLVAAPEHWDSPGVLLPHPAARRAGLALSSAGQDKSPVGIQAAGRGKSASAKPREKQQ